MCLVRKPVLHALVCALSIGSQGPTGNPNSISPVVSCYQEGGLCDWLSRGRDEPGVKEGLDSKEQGSHPLGAQSNLNFSVVSCHREGGFSFETVSFETATGVGRADIKGSPEALHVAAVPGSGEPLSVTGGQDPGLNL